MKSQPYKYNNFTFRMLIKTKLDLIESRIIISAMIQKIQGFTNLLLKRVH